MIKRVDPDVENWARRSAEAARRRQIIRRQSERPTVATPRLDGLTSTLRAIQLEEERPDARWMCKNCAILTWAQDPYQRRALVEAGWDCIRQLCPDCRVTVTELCAN